MPLVFAAMTPHGWPTIPALSDAAAGALQTRQAMQEVGRRATAVGVEVLVLATPPGLRVEGAVCVADVVRGAGVLGWAGRQIEMCVPVDETLTGAIVSAARTRGLPVARVALAGNSRPQSVVPLDWGTMTPLRFLGHDRDMTGSGDFNRDPRPDDIGPPGAIGNPARDLPREPMVSFGPIAAEEVEVRRSAGGRADDGRSPLVRGADEPRHRDDRRHLRPDLTGP